jgi:hypothetical protein
MARPRRDIGGRPLGHAEDILVHDRRMGVRVDQARHHRPARDIQHHRISRASKTRPDISDPATLDHHRPSFTSRSTRTPG